MRKRRREPQNPQFTDKACGDQREPFLPRFEARPPLPSGAGIETRQDNRSKKSSRRDASTRRGGCPASGQQMLFGAFKMKRGVGH
jgi:hypothetical protein